MRAHTDQPGEFAMIIFNTEFADLLKSFEGEKRKTEWQTKWRQADDEEARKRILQDMSNVGGFWGSFRNRWNAGSGIADGDLVSEKAENDGTSPKSARLLTE